MDSHYWGVPPRGGTQDTDFTKGFTKGMSEDFLRKFIKILKVLDRLYILCKETHSSENSCGKS